MKQVVIRVAMLLPALIGIGLVSPEALGQEPNADERATTTGTVVSASANVLVVRTSSGVYNVFTFERYTTKPRTIANGSSVRVISTPSSEPGVRLATDVVVISSAPTEQKDTSSEPVPVSIRQLEDQLERQARRYGVGFRTGAGLDPELLLVGVHAKVGPFFNRNLSFRPNLEFGWGEVTKLFALNLEGVYRLPMTPRLGRWNAYVGAGPSFVFSHENFERDGEEIDFGDFNFNGGLNVLAGLEFRNGVFFEVKSTVYAAPHLRILLGYTF